MSESEEKGGQKEGKNDGTLQRGRRDAINGLDVMTEGMTERVKDRGKDDRKSREGMNEEEGMA